MPKCNFTLNLPQGLAEVDVNAPASALRHFYQGQELSFPDNEVILRKNLRVIVSSD